MARFHWATDSHVYQQAGLAHLLNSTSTLGAAALWLSPGYGKTAIALHAFKALLDAGRAHHMLVVAPLRVVQLVWAQEIEEWASLHGLVAARLHGPKKMTQLARRDVNVWLINYEGAEWLMRMAKGGQLKIRFDVVVFDEIRRLKEPGGLRFKALWPIAKLATWRWGLTGTPAANGLTDLFGQFLILDNGAALGNRVTKFRQQFFEQGYDGFTLDPRPGAREEIEQRIKPYVFRADGLLDLPAFINDPRPVELDSAARKTYAAMKRDMLTQLGDRPITAANAAVLMGKLKQMANGRVYDENREVHKIHSAKADALMDLLEELGDEQLLIAYEFNHDLTQLREILGEGLPFLGAGVSKGTAEEHVRAWNAREIQILAAHPASAGHGLNLQKGGAHHILWWGPTFDLDHFIQFNDRLRRQGNTSSSVVVHTFIAMHTVDEVAIRARVEKATLQDAVLSALTGEFGETSVRHQETGDKFTMAPQLEFRADAAQGQPQAASGFGGFPQTGAGPSPQTQQGFGSFAPQPQAPAPQTQQGFGSFAPQPQAPAPQPQATAPQPQTGFGGFQPQGFGPQVVSSAPPPNATGFASGFPQPGQTAQQQAIAQDVGAAPAPTAEQALAAAGVQGYGSPQASFGVTQVQPQQQEIPFGGPNVVNGVPDAQVISSTPGPAAGAAEKPKRSRKSRSSDEATTAGDTSGAPPQASWTYSDAMVPLSLSIPVSRLSAVLTAIGEALE